MARARSNTQSDSDRTKDALQKLRAENRKLRKANAQLRKALQKGIEVEFDADLDAEIEEMGPLTKVIAAITDKEELPVCPRCRSEDYKEVSAGVFTVKICNKCQYRRRLTEKAV